MQHLPMLALFLLLISSSDVLACTCASSVSGCDDTWHSGEVVFLGSVEAKVVMQAPAVTGDVVDLNPRYAVHFSISESFHGVGKPAAEIVVETGQGNGDCGYPFVVGTSYLVYASLYNGRLATHICSPTMPAVMAGGVLRELRAAHAGRRLDDVFGTVAIAPRGNGFADLVDTQPLANVEVHASSSGGAVFSTTTDQSGAYSFASLPPDAYRLSAVLPSGLSVMYRVTANNGTGAKCRADISARPDGQISGRVEDTSGRGVPGFVTVEPTDPEERRAALKRGGLPGDETADGNFLLPQLPPGRYRLVFSQKVGGTINLQSRFFWPTSTEASDSDGIEVQFGQHVEGVRFVVNLGQNSN